MWGRAGGLSAVARRQLSLLGLVFASGCCVSHQKQRQLGPPAAASLTTISAERLLCRTALCEGAEQEKDREKTDEGQELAVKVWWELHSGNKVEGPGSPSTTKSILQLVLNFYHPTIPIRQVLDLGCGPGSASLTLAQELENVEVLSIDNHQPFLDQLRVAIATSSGLKSR
eukprot:g628.t1